MELCVCTQVPPEGSFAVGRYYEFDYYIDAEGVVDDHGAEIILAEPLFLACFTRCEAVTCFCPMLSDQTLYSVYLLLAEDKPNLEEIRAYAKLTGCNYLQAKAALSQKRQLLAQGKAYTIRDIREKLERLGVCYEIEPPYPYEDA